MNLERLLDVLPHYLALIFIILGVLAAIDAVFAPGFWVELGVVIAIAFAYRPIVLRLGIAPDAWQ